MNIIEEVIYQKSTKKKPIWLMRQAGRYLPEFREVRKHNPDFIKLCLNEDLVPVITLQPLKRFELDAAIIFSDILMLPYGIGQNVKFKKDFGPILGDLKNIKIEDININDFSKRLKPVYNSMNNISSKLKNKKKSLIGFVGAPWTLLVYMINKQSPKKNLPADLINYQKNKGLLKKVIELLKIHIKSQIDNGANIIQIFDSWAGLADDNLIGKFIYEPTAELVDFTKSQKVPVICFPREIRDYHKYIHEVEPSVISIDYKIDIKSFTQKLKIPVQGNLNPSTLLGNEEDIKNQTLGILDVFKDHPHIFNLGHGVLPQTNPNMVEYLVKLVKNY